MCDRLEQLLTLAGTNLATCADPVAHLPSNIEQYARRLAVDYLFVLQMLMESRAQVHGSDAGDVRTSEPDGLELRGAVLDRMHALGLHCPSTSLSQLLFETCRG